MCPVFQLPLDLGADISMTSATKFVGGHSDVTAGILAVRDPELADRIYFVQASERERESGGGVLWRGVVRGVWRAAGKGRCGRGGARARAGRKSVDCGWRSTWRALWGLTGAVWSRRRKEAWQPPATRRNAAQDPSCDADPAITPPLPAQNAEGNALGPFDCWLLLRGIKTMGLRMERQAENALHIARWLQRHALVRGVNHPGLPDHPGHALHFQQVCTQPAGQRGYGPGGGHQGAGAGARGLRRQGAAAGGPPLVLSQPPRPRALGVPWRPAAMPGLQGQALAATRPSAGAGPAPAGEQRRQHPFLHDRRHRGVARDCGRDRAAQDHGQLWQRVLADQHALLHEPRVDPGRRARHQGPAR